MPSAAIQAVDRQEPFHLRGYARDIALALQRDVNGEGRSVFGDHPFAQHRVPGQVIGDPVHVPGRKLNGKVTRRYGADRREAENTVRLHAVQSLDAGNQPCRIAQSRGIEDAALVNDAQDQHILGPELLGYGPVKRANRIRRRQHIFRIGVHVDTQDQRTKKHNGGNKRGNHHELGPRYAKVNDRHLNRTQIFKHQMRPPVVAGFHLCTRSSDLFPID